MLHSLTSYIKYFLKYCFMDIPAICKYNMKYHVCNFIYFRIVFNPYGITRWGHTMSLKWSLDYRIKT